MIESPLKTMKNVFYSILKALFVLKIFTFLLRLLRHVGKTAKFMTSKPRLQTIAIHILLNISQSKGDQTMKFGQKNITREIFFFKIYAENEAMRLVPDVFLFFKKA